MEITNNPHDKFFKASFSDIDTAKDFLDNYLPSELRKRIDLGTLEAAKGSFVDQELEEYHSGPSIQRRNLWKRSIPLRADRT